jgi:hypothetical protein
MPLPALIHERLATTALYYFLILAIWGYYRFFRKQGIDPSYWGALAIAELLVVAEALLGGYLWLSGLRPARDWLHILYGALIPAMIPLAYFYTRGRADRSEAMIYGTVTIITAGLILRAIYTAQVVL